MGDTEELGEVVSQGTPHPGWWGHTGHLPTAWPSDPTAPSCSLMSAILLQFLGFQMSIILLSIWPPFLPLTTPSTSIHASIFLINLFDSFLELVSTPEALRVQSGAVQQTLNVSHIRNC